MINVPTKSDLIEYNRTGRARTRNRFMKCTGGRKSKFELRKLLKAGGSIQRRNKQLHGDLEANDHRNDHQHTYNPVINNISMNYKGCAVYVYKNEHKTSNKNTHFCKRKIDLCL